MEIQKQVKYKKSKNKENSLKYKNKLKALYKKIEALQEDRKDLTIDEFLFFMKEFRSATKNLDILSLLKNFKNLSQNTNQPITPDYDLSLFANILNILEDMRLESISVLNSPIEMYELLAGKGFFKRNLTFGERVASAVAVIARSEKLWQTVSNEIISLKLNSIDCQYVSKICRTALEALEKSPILGKRSVAVINGNISIEKASEIINQYRLIHSEESYKRLKELVQIAHSKNIPDNWIVNIVEE